MSTSGGALPLETIDPSWEIWLQRPNGTDIGALTRLVTQAKATLILNHLWSFGLSLSLHELYKTFGIRDIPLDSMIEFRYKRGITRNFSFFKRKTMRSKDTLHIAGFGLNHLLRRRTTGAYFAGTSYVSKDDYLDDMMREIVNENLYTGAVDRDTLAADTDRDLSQVSGFDFALAPEVSAAPQYAMSLHGKNVFDVLAELSEISTQAGTRLFFNIERTGNNAFEFRTYTDSQGVDRRNLKTFGEKAGNMSGVETTHDHSEEVNFYYVAGQGTGVNRAYEEVENTDASQLSPLNRMEGFRDARQTPTAELTQVGYQELEHNKAVKIFKGQLEDRAGARFGLDWDLGDLLSATDESEDFSIMINAVQIDLNAGKQQSITGRFQVIEDV